MCIRDRYFWNQSRPGESQNLTGYCIVIFFTDNECKLRKLFDWLIVLWYIYSGNTVEIYGILLVSRSFITFLYKSAFFFLLVEFLLLIQDHPSMGVELHVLCPCNSRRSRANLRFFSYGLSWPLSWSQQQRSGLGLETWSWSCHCPSSLQD